jgi:hypothetical protein
MESEELNNEQEGIILKEGVLERNESGEWVKRYFKLFSGRLCFYKLVLLILSDYFI